jgi:hypothetical protein
MTPNTNKFYGLDTNSQEFSDLVQTASHYLGGQENMVTTLVGTYPGSRTILSDSITLVLAISQSALDLNKPMVAFNLCQSFMAAFAGRRGDMTDEEVSDIETMFLTAMAQANPALAKSLNITDETLAEYPKFRARNSDKNL